MPMEELRRLPRGSHGIPADVVARNQRERLVAAMAEVCAERSFAEASVAAVAKQAGVSSLTFYEQFADKRDCLLSAHRQLLGRLLEELDRAREAEDDPAAKVEATVRTALALFAADPPSARLLTVEILAAGPEGAKRHGALVEALGERLRGGPASAADSPPARASFAVDWTRAAGILALIGDRVMAGDAARLPELGDELLALVTSP